LQIDCKVENNPAKLFSLIKEEMEQIPNWTTALAPRIVLGLWHPKFLQPAAEILPFVRRFCISMSIEQVRKHFWHQCHGFSMWYHQLASEEGARFRAECAAAGKEICAWTVNGREDMLQCARWGVYSIITDKPELWRDLKKVIHADRAAALKPTLVSYILPYFQTDSWWFERARKSREETIYLEREGGKFDAVEVPDLVRVGDMGVGGLRPADLA
jgi:phosphatidylglycerol phospholipase C